MDGYVKSVFHETFEGCLPDCYVDAVATSRGSGAIRIAIANYSEGSDAVLTTDWRWNIYDCLCHEIGRDLHTFSMMDDQGHFNTAAFSAAVSHILHRQDSLLIILNTPANNPTGFALSDAEWADVLEVCRLHDKNGKRISILVDIAYIAYAGEKNRVRSFMTQFAGLPEHIFTMFAFSMSKGYTMYGQRAGALVGLSSSQPVIEEFTNLGKYSARTAWSNINRPTMTLLNPNNQRPRTLGPP
jgi:Aspartate/tyrosine/aromatic aminotransferase